MRASIWVGIAVLAVVRDAAGDSTRSCTPAELRTARKEAGKLAHKAARARLLALEKTCSPDSGNEDKPDQEAYWFWSDLALVTLQDGDPVECMRILAGPTDLHDATNQAIAGTKVGAALAYNMDRCAKAHEAAFRDFTSRPCAGAGDHPTTATPDGCLSIEGGAGFDEFKTALEHDKQDDAAGLCPHIAFKPSGKGAKLPLHVAEGGLTSTSSCCGYDQLSFATKAGKRLVRVQSESPSRDCFGGTATTALDTIYEWTGTELKLVEDDSISLH
ncbi:MAG TPA: hypothetical protein VLX92_15725 [Kofleriaceae bacterium]|nr:hypothetical protein [Kofleriaceae bacterium]